VLLLLQIGTGFSLVSWPCTISFPSLDVVAIELLRLKKKLLFMQISKIAITFRGVHTRVVCDILFDDGL
jgi:hypothetical protein